MESERILFRGYAMHIKCKYLLDMLWSKKEVKDLQPFTLEKPCACGVEIKESCEIYYCHCKRIVHAILHYMTLYFLVIRYFNCKDCVFVYSN